MSAPYTPSTASLGQPIVAVVTDKKPRVPTLTAKFAKFLQFGYFLMKKLQNDDGSFVVLEDTAVMDLLHIYASVDDQQAFVQEFFDESKDINKEFRKLVADKKKADAKAAKLAAKPPKAPKEPKEKVVKEKMTKKTKTITETVNVAQTHHDTEHDNLVNDAVLQPTVVDKPKKGKAKKSTTVDPFVEELVTLANSSTTTKESTKASTKESTKESTKASTVDKPKRKYNKKTYAETDNNTLPQLIDSNGDSGNDHLDDHLDELEVEEHTIDGTLFLLSKDFRLFHPSSSTLLGHLVDQRFVPI